MGATAYARFDNPFAFAQRLRHLPQNSLKIMVLHRSRTQKGAHHFVENPVLRGSWVFFQKRDDDLADSLVESVLSHHSGGGKHAGTR